MARISEYEKWERDGELEGKLLLIRGWARDGLTDKQIGENLGLSHNAFCEYKKKYNEFYEALKINKEMADYEVENALFKNCMNGNVTAQIFWLKNRQKEKWRDKVEVANVDNGINNQIINIANLINNPKPNRGEDDVQ